MGLTAFRRSGGVALVAVAAVIVTLLGAPVGAQEEFIPGSGQVEARLLRVGPSAGRLSFAPSVGIAYADYQNGVARALSRLLDFAALDTSIPPELKSQAPVAQVATGDEPQRIETAALPAGSPVRAGGTVQEVKATDQPLGEATFTLGDLSPVPGVLELTGGRAVSRSGVLDGKTRLAEAVVSYGRLAVGGGAVVLQGLTWRVRQTTGAEAKASGTFTIDGITAGGQQLPVPEGGPSPEQWQQANDALEPLGVRIEAPHLRDDEGIVEITPLRIQLSANEATRAVGPPLLDALLPVREPLASGAIEAAPEAAALFTLSDVILGAFAGTGTIDLELGGATAFTEGEAFDDPFGGFDLGGGGFDLGPVAAPAGDFDLGGDVGTTPGDATGAAGTGEDTGGGSDDIELAGARRRAGTTGGPALVVGLLGLAAVLGMAAADWWRLRHEPRRIVIP